MILEYIDLVANFIILTIIIIPSGIVIIIKYSLLL